MKKYAIGLCLMATVALAGAGVKPDAKGGNRCQHVCDMAYHAGIENCMTTNGGAGINNAGFQACAMDVVEEYHACMASCPNH